MSIDALDAALAITSTWFVIGLLGLTRPHNVMFVARVLFPLGACAALALMFSGLEAMRAPPSSVVLVAGLPDLPFHLRLDALSGFFLTLLGAASTGISIYAAGYFRSGEGTAPGLLCLQYHVFLASMALVLLADDAYGFMVAWETMALSSYFLVTTQHRIPEIRRAGFLYLLIAHLGAIGILLTFGILQGGSWQFTFSAMREAELSPMWASVAFGLALFGFGAKAGLVPLHVWLPEAHPAAPSPVSALMSGVMLKTAIYGMLGSLAILGMPPFGVFASEFLVLTTAMKQEPWAAPILLFALGVAFAAIFGRVQSMVFGEPTGKPLPHPPALIPVFTHLGLVLMLGLYIPPYLADWYRQAARLLG